MCRLSLPFIYPGSAPWGYARFVPGITHFRRTGEQDRVRLPQILRPHTQAGVWQGPKKTVELTLNRVTILIGYTGLFISSIFYSD